MLITSRLNIPGYFCVSPLKFLIMFLSRLQNLFPFASFCYLPELSINCVVSLRREFADGTEFKTRGTRSQIPENLGHVPEFGTLQVLRATRFSGRTASISTFARGSLSSPPAHPRDRDHAFFHSRHSVIMNPIGVRE